MAVAEITQAAEQRLLAITPSIPTAFEGVHFEPPAGIYQRCQFVVSPPEDPVLGLGYYRERIEFQVFISAPAGFGAGEALERERHRRGREKGKSGDRGKVRRRKTRRRYATFRKEHDPRRV